MQHPTNQSHLPPRSQQEVDNLVNRIHKEGQHKLALIATGGAAHAAAYLLSVPGASKSVLEVQVPYAKEALSERLGKEPEQYVSRQTAVDMAKVALQRAAALSAFGTPILGVGATCTLASEPIKKGDHRFYIAGTNGLHTIIYHMKLEKGLRNRQQEDCLASKAVILLISHICGLNDRPAERTFLELVQDEQLIIDETRIEDPIESLIEGKCYTLEISGDIMLVDCPRPRRVYLPGSFNPLHNGHKGMLQSVCKSKHLQGAFELSIGNADKGMLSADEIRRRLKAFQDEKELLPIVLTKEPLFTGKARNLFQNSKLVIGYDTAIRIVMPKYYNNSFMQMVLEFAELRAMGCSFVVLGRKGQDGSFKTLKDVDIPEELGDLFEEVSEKDFRMDISSTELREKQARES